MTQDQAVVAAAQFFLDEFDDNPDGVTYWFKQNHPNEDIRVFIEELNRVTKKG